jgi:hypothetical protein
MRPALQGTLDRAAAQMAYTMVLIAIAGTVALVLGLVGIFGVMSYTSTSGPARSGSGWRWARSPAASRA